MEEQDIQPSSPSEQNKPSGLDRNKKIMLVLATVSALAVMITLVLVFLGRSDDGVVSKETSEKSTFFPWAALIPTWILIFSKKRREAISDKKKLVYGILVAVTVLLVLLTVAVMLWN